MTTQWVLQTHAAPLGAVQQFLSKLFQQAELDRMLVPLRETDSAEITPTLVRDPEQFKTAAPFAPTMSVNTAYMVAELVEHYPDPEARLGVVLRACELRALMEIAERDMMDYAPFDLDTLLIVGVDCIGTVSQDDTPWRDDIDQLTHKALRFARQGGVAMYRCRPACQMCVSPIPVGADLTIGILGLPIQQAVLITARDEQLASQLRLDKITDGEAPAALIDQHEQMRTTLSERRGRARDRLTHALGTDFAMDVDGLIAHLETCKPCEACLSVCPICASEVSLYENDGALSRDAVVDWLASCAGCGMCEQACPDHLPLTAIIGRISRELVREPG